MNNCTWDPKQVLDFVSTWPSNENLSIKNLSQKLIILLALVTGHRMQTFFLINIENIEKADAIFRIKIPDNIKTSGINKKQPILILHYYSNNNNTCVASALQCYLDRTKATRGIEKSLFIAYKAPFKKVTSQTLSRWVKELLFRSGVDTNISTAHSTRLAATLRESRECWRTR